MSSSKKSQMYPVENVMWGKREVDELDLFMKSVNTYCNFLEDEISGRSLRKGKVKVSRPSSTVSSSSSVISVVKGNKTVVVFDECTSSSSQALKNIPALSPLELWCKMTWEDESFVPDWRKERNNQ